MTTEQLKKATRDLGSKFKARGIIVIVISDEDLEAEAWAPSKAEQQVTEDLMFRATYSILNTINAAADADTATKGRNKSLQVAHRS